MIGVVIIKPEKNMTNKQKKKKKQQKSPKSFCGFLTIANKRESWGILNQYLFYGNNFFCFCWSHVK